MQSEDGEAGERALGRLGVVAGAEHPGSASRGIVAP
jgi:hypothetical protein